MDVAKVSVVDDEVHQSCGGLAKSLVAPDCSTLETSATQSSGLQETRLCHICSSPGMQEFWELTCLDDIYNTKKDHLGRDYRCVRLGSWTEIQHRASTCDFCSTILSLLSGVSFEKIFLDDLKGLLENHCWHLVWRPRYYQNIGREAESSRVSISLERYEKKDYLLDGCYYVELRNAFHVSDTFLREPELKMGSDLPTVPTPRFRPDICDSALLRSWLDLCRTKHGDKCIVHYQNPMATIRLVDVHARTVISFAQVDDSGIPSYVSLSWVWGSARSYDGLSTARFPHAHHGGFLDTLRLPPVIADSIIFLQGVGIRYLWVDLLCIVQDSPADKKLYIPMMGLIYSASDFTIIACDKMGALGGLPGIRGRTRRKKQELLKYSKLFLVAGLDPRVKKAYPSQKFRDPVPDPPWQTRAWTFQEKLLSPRCLIFGTNQIHWECLKASYCEEIAFENSIHGTSPFLKGQKSLFHLDTRRRPKEQHGSNSEEGF